MSLLIQTRPLFHWRKCYYGLWTHILVKMLDLLQLLSSQDINWWTGVVWITCGLLWCFYQLFGLSFWRHPFTTEHPLLSKWCNAIFLQIWWRNKLIYILDFHFWLNYSFKCTFDIFWFYTAHLGNAYSMHDKFCRKSSMLYALSCCRTGVWSVQMFIVTLKYDAGSR